MRGLFFIFALLALVFVVDAREDRVARLKRQLLTRQTGQFNGPTTVTTTRTAETFAGTVIETCTITLTPVTGPNGQNLVREERKCSTQLVKTSSSGAPASTSTVQGSASTQGTTSMSTVVVTATVFPGSFAATATPASASSTTTSASTSATQSTSSAASSTQASSTTEASSSSTAASTSAAATSAATSSATTSAAATSAVATSSAATSAAASSSVATSSIAKATGGPAKEVGTATKSGSAAPASSAASSTTATAAPQSAPTSASAAAAEASASATPFTLPGKKLEVLPIGLGVFAGISVIALIVVGLVTYERTKYRKAFRQRKLAEQGAGMGYSGMSERV